MADKSALRFALALLARRHCRACRSRDHRLHRRPGRDRRRLRADRQRHRRDPRRAGRRGRRQCRRSAGRDDDRRARQMGHAGRRRRLLADRPRPRSTRPSASNDIQAASSPFSAAIDIAPAVNPQAIAIAINRAAGVTRAVVAPGNAGHSIFAGQGAVIDLGGDMQPITRARLFQFIELGEDGGQAAGGSRASAHALLRNALREAGELRLPIAGPGRRAAAAPSVAAARGHARYPHDRAAGPAARRRPAHPLRCRRARARWCAGGNCCSSMSSGPATSSRCWR